MKNFKFLSLSLLFVFALTLSSCNNAKKKNTETAQTEVKADPCKGCTQKCSDAEKAECEDVDVKDAKACCDDKAEKKACCGDAEKKACADKKACEGCKDGVKCDACKEKAECKSKCEGDKACESKCTSEADKKCCGDKSTEDKECESHKHEDGTEHSH